MKPKQSGKKAHGNPKTPEKSPRNLRKSTNKDDETNKNKAECGMCNRPLTKAQKKETSAFVKNCVLCSSKWFNHPLCAKKHFYSVNLEMSQDDVTKPSTTILKNNITPKQFDTCIIPYYCKECYLPNCFVCGRKHTSTDHTKSAKCNGCNKKWFVITQTCINKEKNPLCPTCTESSQASATANTSNTSKTSNSETISTSTKIDLKTTPTSDLHRIMHNNDPEATLERIVPKDTHADVMSAIQNAYQIDIEDQEYFTDFSSAKEYFYRSFSYISNENANLFVFECPHLVQKRKMLANQGNIKDFHAHNRNCFDISFNDVKSLFDGKMLTKGMVNFVLDIFNFYAINSTSDDSVPDFMFGNHKIMQAVVPHQKNYHKLWEYYNLIQDDNDKLDDQTFSTQTAVQLKI